MNEWQPIETAPKDGTSVLVCWRYQHDGSFGMTSANWRLGPSLFWGEPDKECWRSVFDGAQSINDALFEDPTHWMSLPPPPALVDIRSLLLKSPTPLPAPQVTGVQPIAHCATPPSTPKQGEGE